MKTQDLARLRARLQELSQLLHAQWALRFAAHGKGSDILDMAARIAGNQTIKFIRGLRDEFGWIPYKVIDRDVMVVPHLGIRCQPTRTVTANPQPEISTVTPMPFIGNIGWNGANKAGKFVPVCGRGSSCHCRKPSPCVTVRSDRLPGRGRGRGMYGLTGLLPTCRPPRFSYAEVFYPGTIIRRPGHERGAISAPSPAVSSTSAPSPTVSSRGRGRGRGRGHAEPRLFQASGGRFID